MEKASAMSVLTVSALLAAAGSASSLGSGSHLHSLDDRLALANHGPVRPDPRPGHPGPQAASMTVWYLGHCGFAVRVGNKLLVFDYVSNLGSPPGEPETGGFADGTVEPEDLDGLEVFVFASHAHGDHFDRVIMDWADAGESVHYFFGWQAGDVDEHHYMVGPNATVEVEEVKVYTVNSVPDGIPEVAYLVEIDGLWIYHNGDHFTRDDGDLDYLAGLSSEIDLAFVPGYAASGAPFFEKEIRFLGRFEPEVVIPMHRGGEEEATQQWAQVLSDRGLTLDFRFPRARGDRFELGR